jgi:hypothetical protein
MIAFDLACGSDHRFEGWFRSSADFAAQQSARQILCPLCGDEDVRKAVMAPAVGRKGNQLATVPASAAPAHTNAMTGGRTMSTELLAMAAAMAEAQAAALPSSTWVGKDFAARARAMHDGEEANQAIHGQASRDEVEALVEDGVPVMPLLVPVVPPELKN